MWNICSVEYAKESHFTYFAIPDNKIIKQNQIRTPSTSAYNTLSVSIYNSTWWELKNAAESLAYISSFISHDS